MRTQAPSRSPSPWRGVRFQPIAAAADPDAPPRPVFVPVGWTGEAAAALVALAPPGRGPLRLPQATEAWTRRFPAPLAAALHRLIVARRAAPDAALWRGSPEAPPRFVLNLAAFAVPGEGFDLPGFRDALATIAATLALAVPHDAPAPAIGFADLAGLLAALGLAYDSAAARGVARGLAALLRAQCAGPPLPAGATLGPVRRLSARSEVSNGPQDSVLSGILVGVPTHAFADDALPTATAIPGLAHARLAAPPVRAIAALALPGPAEALLGVETGGIAPAFAPFTATGALTGAARAWLAATGIGPEQALAAQLAGRSVFPTVSPGAEAAMAEAVAPFMALPARAAPAPAAATPTRRDLPARRAGYTQRASIGGHRLYLSTGQYADGTLGEISVALHKESPAFRGLMESLCAAVSLGLQHGVPLDAFVEAFAQTHFAPAGPVEGDPAVTAAASVVDYLARHLAASYLGRTDLPAPPAEDPLTASPSLPLDLPAARPRPRPRLRVVG